MSSLTGVGKGMPHSLSLPACSFVASSYECWRQCETDPLTRCMEGFKFSMGLLLSMPIPAFPCRA